MSKQRSPSIHISEANLKLVLSKVLGNIKDTQVIDILSYARKYQLSGRKLLDSNEKTTQKTKNLVKSSVENSLIMAKVIYYNRRKLKHRGIELTTPGHKDFAMVKTITKNALEYHEAFNHLLPIEESFNNYVTTALKRMDNKFSLPKLQYGHVGIMEFREAAMVIQHDNNTTITELAYRYYTQQVIRQVGSLLVDYKQDPTKYKYFVMVAEECKKLGIKAEDYIKAQFEGLAWTNGIPNPEQLVGDKAQERLQKYLYQNQIQLGLGTQKSIDTIKKLKDLRKLK